VKSPIVVFGGGFVLLTCVLAAYLTLTASVVVTFRVTGDVPEASVSTHANGSNSQGHRTLPWSELVTVESRQIVSLTATSLSGSIVCEMLRNGQPWRRATADHASCNVSGNPYE
jgi:hypothetical protein